MPFKGLFSTRRNLALLLLGTAVLSAVVYGVVTYQTPYGCDATGVASGPDVNWQVLAKPCIYIYFTGIVGGSVFLILLIPVPEKKNEATASASRSNLANDSKLSTFPRLSQ